MGIDGVGKNPGLPPTAGVGTGAVSSTHAPSQAFQAERTGETSETTGAASTGSAGNVGAASANSPLARLRSGEIDVNGYVDLKVEEATSGLKGLSADELAFIKGVLRDQTVTDPGLADLTHMATGQMPKPA
ncbi:MAG: hypothetical protein FWD73_03445 [Polyangiaceae bacterium]|nr:hypothetical protein [Polyangiaceae bacterium]